MGLLARITVDDVLILWSACLCVGFTAYLLYPYVRMSRIEPTPPDPFVIGDSFVWKTPDELQGSISGHEVEVFASDYQSALGCLDGMFPELPADTWRSLYCRHINRTKI